QVHRAVGEVKCAAAAGPEPHEPQPQPLLVEPPRRGWIFDADGDVPEAGARFGTRGSSGCGFDGGHTGSSEDVGGLIAYAPRSRLSPIWEALSHASFTPNSPLKAEVSGLAISVFHWSQLRWKSSPWACFMLSMVACMLFGGLASQPCGSAWAALSA